MMPYWSKACAAASTAERLVGGGDLDGAVNRAYYAVFSAARAAVATVRTSFAVSKRHGTIVNRLERHLVAGGSIAASSGRPLLQRLQHLRWVADYAPVSVDPAQAEAALADMRVFLAAVEPIVAARSAKAKRRAPAKPRRVATQDATHG
jgi:uncharacterized protein (UPF0332 family)